MLAVDPKRFRKRFFNEFGLPDRAERSRGERQRLQVNRKQASELACPSAMESLSKKLANSEWPLGGILHAIWGVGATTMV